MSDYYQIDEDGIQLLVRLSPNASSDRIYGEECLADGTKVLKIKVRAVPEKGRANKALMKLLAKSLHIAPSHVSILKGAAARIKTLRIAGNPSELATGIEQFRRQAVT